MTQQEFPEETSSSVWPRPAVSVAVFRDGKVLLAQRAKPPLKGVWSLPGGRVEPGELSRAAALRELKEETGVTAQIEGITDIVDVILRHEDGSVRAHYVITSFYGRWTSGEPRPESDCLGAEWVGLDELSGRKITVGTTEIIQQAARLHTSAQTEGA